MKTIEYRVRPVTRYIVTRFERQDDNNGLCSGGSEGCGEFDREDSAEKIAMALANAETHGRVICGSRPVYTTTSEPRDLGEGMFAPASVSVTWGRETVVREE